VGGGLALFGLPIDRAITLDDLQMINRALASQGKASHCRAALTVFEKQLRRQCRGAYSAPNRLDHGRGRGIPAPTLSSRLFSKTVSAPSLAVALVCQATAHSVKAGRAAVGIPAGYCLLGMPASSKRSAIRRSVLSA